jgi:hypothetical protein
MFSISPNPHKKGEHVFNDLAGSVANAFKRAIGFERAKSMLLVGPYGPLSKRDLPVSFGWVTVIRLDPILLQSRTLVAPANRLHDDKNSIEYGRAKTQFETTLCRTVEAIASLAWKRRPHRNSSFLELDPTSRRIIGGIKDVNSAVFEARIAFGNVTEMASDKDAAAATLSEKVSTSEVARRLALIEATRAHLPNVKNMGDTLISSFAEELKCTMDKRIGHLD